MKLKRIFKEGEVDGVKVEHAGPRQHFSPRVLSRGAAEGWLSLNAGKIELRKPGGGVAVSYRIVRSPGTYCSHCQADVGNEHAARRHVLTEHAGVAGEDVPGDNDTLAAEFARLLGSTASPDPNNPAGYRRDNFFACEKE